MSTTYYVSTAGSDSNNGLSPDATTANTNKPWLTLGKAMATGSPVVPGDTVYIGPGIIYQGGGITPISGISSVGSPTAFRGDPTNVQGFKDSSGVLLSPAPSWITPRTSGDGVDGPMTSGATLLTLTTNSCKGLQFYNLCMEASATGAILVVVSIATNSDILFQDCRLMALHIFSTVTAATTATAGRNWTIDRCLCFANDVVLISSTNPAATADADLNIVIKNSLVFGTLTSTLALSASGGNVAGGIHFIGVTCVLSTATLPQIQTIAATVSTTTPITLEGCLFIGGRGVVAGTSGHVIDNGYNRFYNSGSASNYSAAGTSFSGILPQIVLPDLAKWGLDMPRNDIFGWTDNAASAQAFSGWTNTTADFRGRTVRPWGAGPSVGCWQAQAVAQDTGSNISGGGANSLKITGQGEVSLWIPVDATSTTVTVHTKSSSYGGSTWPQLIVVANPSLGITSDKSVSATSASDQSITTASFTPTAKGVMEVRLISNSTSTSSSTYFDLLSSP